MLDEWRHDEVRTVTFYDDCGFAVHSVGRRVFLLPVLDYRPKPGDRFSLHYIQEHVFDRAIFGERELDIHTPYKKRR